MKRIFDHVADYFIPSGLKLSSEEIIKARVLINSCFLASGLVLLTGINSYFLTDRLSFSFIAITTLFCAIPWSIKKLGHYKSYSYLLPTLTLAILPILSYYQGGIRSVPALWFVASPILSLYFMGPKKGLIYSIVGLVFIICFLHLHTRKFIFPTTSFSINEEVIHFGIGVICLYVFITYLTWHYEKSTLENQHKLKLSEQKAIQANKIKDIFWANISHEIRTPLNGILGMTNLLLDSRLNKDQKEFLKIIRDSAENLNIILSDVIDYSKIETNELEIQKRPFSLIKTLDQVIQMFDHMASEKSIKIFYSIDSDVPNGILTDEERLRQILINLVANAIKFTEKGAVKILVERATREDMIKFSVEDTGIGIPQNQIDNLFRPFTQIDGSNARKYGGTGLGLVIVKSLVEKLGGRIKVDSQLGHGSTFSFSIRVMVVQVQNSETKKNEDFKNMDFHKNIPLKILVVEDNPVNRKIMVSLLNKNGYNPDIAENGLEGVEKATRNMYDLIFMDLQMPVMDGFTATKEIFENHPEVRPKVVAVTANVLQEDRDKCFEAGMDDFMAKPINNNILLSILNRYSKQIIKSNNVSHKFETTQSDTLNEDNLVNSEIEFKTFDKIELLDNFSDDMFVIETIVKQFTLRYQEDLNLLKRAIKERDYQSIELQAHSLKGSFGSLFCKKGLSLAIQMERLGKNTSTDNAEYIIRDLDKLCPELITELDRFLNKTKVA